MIDLDQFRLTKDPKKGVTSFEFCNGNRWVHLTKQTSDLFAAKTLKEKFDGVATMKKFVVIDKTPPPLEKSFKDAAKLKGALPTDLEMESIPLEELSSLVEEIHDMT